MGTLKVVSTINLPKLPAGTVTWTDPEIPYVAGCLRAGFLLPLEPYEPVQAEPDVEVAPQEEQLFDQL